MDFNFLHRFNGVIWNTLINPERKLLFLETRDVEQKKVSFSALDVETNSFLWKEITFEEPWWVNLAGVSGNILLLNVYTDAANPGKKSIIAFDVDAQIIKWWINDFSLSYVARGQIIGFTDKLGLKEIVINASTGQPETEIKPEVEEKQNFTPIRPFQYHHESRHFETLQSFLSKKCSVSAMLAIEYLEYDSLIIISAYVQENDLANYLFVFNRDGGIIMHEKLDEHLKGIGMDTFFIFSGCLIFVKNKRELVSYKIV